MKELVNKDITEVIVIMIYMDKKVEKNMIMKRKGLEDIKKMNWTFRDKKNVSEMKNNIDYTID